MSNHGSVIWRMISVLAPLLFTLALIALAYYTYQAVSPLSAIGGSPIP